MRVKTVDGVAFMVDAGDTIKPGDLYIGERNTGPHLLTCEKALPIGQGGYVIPVEATAYCYDIWECHRVVGMMGEKGNRS